MEPASDAHHTERLGKAIKGSDYSCVPLGRECHTRLHTVPEAEFWNGINVEGIKRYLIGVYNRIDKAIVADWRRWGAAALDGEKAMVAPVNREGTGIDWQRVPGLATQFKRILKPNAGKWMEVAIKEHKPRRTIQQNAKWYAMIRQLHQHWTETLGNDFSFEDAVAYVKSQDEVWGSLPTKAVPMPDGTTRGVRSTRALDVPQHSYLLESTGAWAMTHHGVSLLGETD
jgi:hypothetical protein